MMRMEEEPTPTIHDMRWAYVLRADAAKQMWEQRLVAGEVRGYAGEYIAAVTNGDVLSECYGGTDKDVAAVRFAPYQHRAAPASHLLHTHRPIAAGLHST